MIFVSRDDTHFAALTIDYFSDPRVRSVSYVACLCGKCMQFGLYGTPFRIGPFRFQAGGRRRRPNPALVFLGGLFLCCSIFCYGCMFAFIVFDFVFQY